MDNYFRLSQWIVIGVISGVIVPLGYAKDTRPLSANEFSQGLEELVHSSQRLQSINEQLNQTNNRLAEQVKDLEGEIQNLQKNNTALENQLKECRDRSKGLEDKFQDHQKLNQEHKKQAVGIEQEIALFKIRQVELHKQQKYLLDLLVLAEENNSVKVDFSDVKDNQLSLRKQAQEGLKRVNQLNEEWNRLSFWYGDKATTVPKLQAMRQDLQFQLSEYQKLNVSELWLRNQKRKQKLESEVKRLVRQGDSLLQELQVIEIQYLAGPSNNQAKEEERKLQVKLGKLKRENKQLQSKVSELKVQMVELDKKKMAIEKKYRIYE